MLVFFSIIIQFVLYVWMWMRICVYCVAGDEEGLIAYIQETNVTGLQM